MQGTISLTVQEPDLKRAEAYCPEPLVLGSKPHGFPAQGLFQVNPLFLLLDLSVGGDPSHRGPSLVLWGVHPPGVGTYR